MDIKKTIPEIQQDRVPHLGCTVQVRRISFQPTNTGTFGNTDVENQEPSGDRSHNDPHPEVEFSACRASNLTDSDPDETSHSFRGF